LQTKLHSDSLTWIWRYRWNSHRWHCITF